LCYAPNLKWKNIDFKEVFGEKDFEIMVENDSKLSLLAESFYSSDIKNSSNAFFLYLGEGVGGAIFINGRMIRGMNSAAGEIGHTLLRICDGLVEVEKLLSIANLLENFEKRKNIEEGGTLKDRFVKLQKAWFSGDRTAKELLEKFLDNLAIVLRNVCYMLNPQVVVFGGCTNNFWETFGSTIQERLARLDDYGFLQGIVFRDNLFKNVSAPLLGCNVMAINKLIEDLAG